MRSGRSAALGLVLLLAAATRAAAHSPSANWRAWLKEVFPDASRSWPAAGAKKFERIAAEGRWDFIGKGDADRDGAPTGLLIRAREASGSARKDRAVFSRLLIVRWKDGRWRELLRLDDGAGASMNGKALDYVNGVSFEGGYEVSFSTGGGMVFPDEGEERDEGRGLVVSALPLNRNGSTAVNFLRFWYSPKKKKYVFEAH